MLLPNLSTNKKKQSRQNTSTSHAIASSFIPSAGAGRIYIGFRTSQTTGLAAHLSAPLVPTVEREAIDLQDPTLSVYNSELLEVAGVLMRLSLEHAMANVGVNWVEKEAERKKEEEEYKNKGKSAFGEHAVGREIKEEEVEEEEEDDDEDEKTSSKLMGFARFMAKGVKRQIVNAIKTVDEFVLDSDGLDDTLLKPPDVIPLRPEEKDAVVLMRSFCPQQSTPDATVGTMIAKGFSSAMPGKAPPVLTQTGVVRGDEARLPNSGMEAFVRSNVVRSLLYKNAEEYHGVVAGCRKLNVQDVAEAMTSGNVLEEGDVIRLVRWWVKYGRIEPAIIPHGQAIKDSVLFFAHTPNGKEAEDVRRLRDILFYADGKMFPEGLPMPETVLPSSMHDQIGQRVLKNPSLSEWFSPLPMDVWSVFISQHPSMTEGNPKDSKIRLLSLTVLNKEVANPATTLRSLFSNKKCIPTENPDQSEACVTDCPSNLYLESAELSAFDGVGGDGASSFKKVSKTLKKAGISDDFLLGLGVRKAVAVEFLFAHLDTLRWDNDPKPLITYLRTSTLSDQDMGKLRVTQYLPEKDDTSKAYAPSELYLPHPDLSIFPFVKVLKWPSGDELSEHSSDATFLKRLGCPVDPPLLEVINFTANVQDEHLRILCLEFMSKRLGPGGVYTKIYSSSQTFMNLKFLPCIRKVPLDGNSTPRKEIQSPKGCYSNPAPLSMGFHILDPLLDRTNSHSFGNRFRCPEKPTPETLVKRLLDIVSFAKSKTSAHDNEAMSSLLSSQVLSLFGEMFNYLSTVVNEFDKRSVTTLKKASFIPCISGSSIEWHKPGDVYFKNSNNDDAALTELLFHVTEFSPFLAAMGVKNEASSEDLFHLLIATPYEVLKKVGGEEKYRTILRRIATDPPLKTVTNEMKKSPFLIAYRPEVDGDAKPSSSSSSSSTSRRSNFSKGENVTKEQNVKYVLAKAEDICIVDNSHFGRMFPVLRAPHESDLEDFYAKVGSKYISERVEMKFDILGTPRSGTPLAVEFANRIRERRPLLISPHVTSRPLVKDAERILDDEHLNFFEVAGVRAVYTLDSETKFQDITCCTKPTARRKNALYVTQAFDWFDVGNAIGYLILKHCNVEHAFFLGSLLDAPLDQLRARGFPVDRVLRPVAPDPAPQSSQEPRQGRRGDNDQNAVDDEAFYGILKEMFPDCNEEYIRAQLGPNPTPEKAKEVSEHLSSGVYPKKDDNVENDPPKGKENEFAPEAKPASSPDVTTTAKDEQKYQKNKRNLGKKIGKALGGIRKQRHKAPSTHPVDDGIAVSPQQDASSQKGLEQMLKQQVRESRAVDSSSISSPESRLTGIPEGLDNGCEVLLGHELSPFCTAENGMKVFSRTNSPESEAFLRSNQNIVRAFSEVLFHLTNVYSLKVSTVAIFHEPSGPTIAFNLNKGLHFNIRFFHSLHYDPNSPPGRSCYSYWFTTMAHELAHNLVSEHRKEHGYYTESFVTLYLPKLVSFFSQHRIS